jgi:hypothetical protein
MIRNINASVQQCAERAVTDLLSNGRATTDANFPLAFVESVIKLMFQMGYRESYVKSRKFVTSLRTHLAMALRDQRQGPADCAILRNFRRELVDSSNVATEIKVACLSADVRMSLPRRPFRSSRLLCLNVASAGQNHSTLLHSAPELLVASADLQAELDGRSALLRQRL